MKRIATLLLAAAALVAARRRAGDRLYRLRRRCNCRKDTFMGSATGVATNSKGARLRLYPQRRAHRDAGRQPRLRPWRLVLYEFAPDGKFIRQIGKQVYGFLAAQAGARRCP